MGANEFGTSGVFRKTPTKKPRVNRAEFVCARPGRHLYRHVMPSIAEFEALLAECAHVIREHDKTVMSFASLPDSDGKRAMLAQFEETLRIATDTEQKTREALNRKRAKLN